MTHLRTHKKCHQNRRNRGLGGVSIVTHGWKKYIIIYGKIKNKFIYFTNLLRKRRIINNLIVILITNK